nr:ComEC/Rec2 family competence protein [Ningiella ruwaisensis]
MFIAVFLSSILWPKLPGVSLIVCSLLLVIFVHLTPVKSLPTLSACCVGALLAFAWASSMGHWYSQWQLNDAIFHQNIIIEARVTSVISPSLNKSEQQDSLEGISSLRFNVELARAGKYRLYTEPEVRLSWYKPSFHIQQGQKLKLLVKLKPPSSLANPHSFNYQKWLAGKNIVASGYVINSPSNEILNASSSLRQRAINELARHSLKTTSWLSALSFGYRGDFSDDDWELLQISGTAHLFAISGLHVGVVFSFCVLLFKRPLAYLLSLFFHRQLQLNPVYFVLAAGICIIYGYLAGFEIPVVRALIAMALGVYLLVFNQHWRLISIFLHLCCLIFLFFPLSILGLSFWFSFLAVVSIWLFLWRFKAQGYATKQTLNDSKNDSYEQGYTRVKSAFFRFCSNFWLMIKLQFWLSAVTLPLSWYAFGHIPMFGIIANLLLVPIVSMVLVPLTLIASASMLFGLDMPTLFIWADKIMGVCIDIMKYLSAQHIASGFVVQSPDLSVLITIAIVILLLLLPFMKWRKRMVAFGCLLIVSKTIPDNMHVSESLSQLALGVDKKIMDKNVTSKINKNAEIELIVFDVGQSSAALLINQQTSSRPRMSEALAMNLPAANSHQDENAWLFDTGSASPSGFSMAESVIYPYLKGQRVERLSRVFISHFDNDHAGGLAFLQSHIEILSTHSVRDDCIAGQRWQMNKFVSVQALWPLEQTSGDNNNDSCVLMLNVNGTKVLFAGDIEHEAETAMLSYYSSQDGDLDALNADILLAPHHGSESSSTPAFVNAVSAQTVIFQSGLYNRWNFPHQKVVERYQDTAQALYETGRNGAIRIRFSVSLHAKASTDDLYKISSYRDDEYSRWYFKVK